MYYVSREEDWIADERSDARLQEVNAALQNCESKIHFVKGFDDQASHNAVQIDCNYHQRQENLKQILDQRAQIDKLLRR